MRPISAAQDSARTSVAQDSHGFAVDQYRGQCVVKPISIAQVSASRHRTKPQYGRLVISNAYDSKRGCFGTRARSRIEEDKVELTRAVAGQA